MGGGRGGYRSGQCAQNQEKYVKIKHVLRDRPVHFSRKMISYTTVLQHQVNFAQRNIYQKIAYEEGMQNRFA